MRTRADPSCVAPPAPGASGPPPAADEHADAADLRGFDVVYSSPVLDMPESRMFGFPTRLADAWVPRVEQSLIPAESLAGLHYRVRVEDGTLRPPRVRGGAGRWRRLAARTGLGARRRVDGLVLDGRDDTDQNIAHILCNNAGRALTAEAAILEQTGCRRRVSVLLHGTPSAMAREVYDALDIPILASDDAVEGRIVRVSLGGEQALLSQLARLLAGRIGEPPEGRRLPERVFIDRRGQRALVNADAVRRRLDDRGFERLYFEDIPVLEQWWTVAHARVVVAVHGAAVSSLLHCGSAVDRARRGPGPPSVIELFGAGYVVNLYRCLAATVGARWCGVRGRITPEIVRDLDGRGRARSHALRSFEIDLDALDMALAYMGAD